MRIGVIGLGQMGRAMALNLVKAGHEVTVWNRSRDKAAPLLVAGARWAGTPAAAAAGEVVCTMLADDAALEAVVFGENGIQGAPALHVSHSTISVDLAARLAREPGAGFVSAPVFGRPAAAEAAKLFIVAAGTDEAVARCQPLFEAVGQRVFRVGTQPEAANRVKLSGNFMIMATIEALAEAMTFAEAGGVDRRVLLEVLTGTLFGAPVTQVYGDILVQDRFRPAGFPAPLGLKDMNLVGAAATSSGVSMPVLDVVREHLRTLIASEGPDVDWSGIALTIRAASSRA